MNIKDESFNTTEKIIFYAGVIILVFLLGYLAFQIYTKESTPVQLKISTRYIPHAPHYKFKVIVENTGGKTAEAINLTLKLFQRGKTVETGTITMRFVPVHSKKTAFVVFYEKRDDSDSLVVSSLTYIIP